MSPGDYLRPLSDGERGCGDGGSGLAFIAGVRARRGGERLAWRGALPA